ncbi:13976_t:CDS:1 [Cetraspora pellucida]|uniref:13976_t:CDS:1 n=1 Tax=Cetraspora pellucida TaxID=1433469 RepID=A0A9N9NI74_9GLOM|nr:13976_t:CDS:1 [Cetraspora pellucida]
MDETGFVLVPKLEKVVVKKGACQVHKVAHGILHEHISVASTISAARSYIPPLIIYKGIHVIPGLLEGAPPGTVMGFTITEYMREDLFQMYLTHFNNSIPPTRLVLLMLDGHKSHISYMSVDFCRKNGILLYALPPHTMHILQPSEIPFAKLKSEYAKESDKYKNHSGKVVMKHTFAKVFGPAFLKTYKPLAICNAYKSTGIWPLNPEAISSDHLDPSLATERFDIVPSNDQPSAQQNESLPLLSNIQPSTQSDKSPSQSSTNLNHHLTRSNTFLLEKEKEILLTENNFLKNENELLKVQFVAMKEELETYKNPGTCSLRSALKYLVPRISNAETPKASLDPHEFESPSPKKRKTLPFAQLLTSENSWQQLKMANKVANKKVTEANRKKEEQE